MVEVITSREDYAVSLITGIDNALQVDDWLTVEENLLVLKDVSPGLYRNALRILGPLLSPDYYHKGK